MAFTPPVGETAQGSAADQVFAFLEAEILSGRISGGSRLRIRQLAELVGTSVMPVREALLRLEDSGLIFSVPHKGATVKEFDTREFMQIYAVRCALESEAAFLGAQHVTAEALDEMEVHLHSLDRAMTEKRFIDAIRADADFLRILYAATGNELLCDMIEQLWKRSDLYRTTAISVDPEFATAYTNRQILDALRSGDAEEARRVSRHSIEIALARLNTWDARKAATENRQ